VGNISGWLSLRHMPGVFPNLTLGKKNSFFFSGVRTPLAQSHALLVSLFGHSVLPRIWCPYTKE
jgi:hypothetical protein